MVQNTDKGCWARKPRIRICFRREHRCAFGGSEPNGRPNAESPAERKCSKMVRHSQQPNVEDGRYYLIIVTTWTAIHVVIPYIRKVLTRVPGSFPRTIRRRSVEKHTIVCSTARLCLQFLGETQSVQRLWHVAESFITLTECPS